MQTIKQVEYQFTTTVDREEYAEEVKVLGIRAKVRVNGPFDADALEITTDAGEVIYQRPTEPTPPPGHDGIRGYPAHSDWVGKYHANRRAARLRIAQLLSDPFWGENIIGLVEELALTKRQENHNAD